MSALFIAIAIACGFILGLRVGLALGKRNAEKAALARRKQ